MNENEETTTKQDYNPVPALIGVLALSTLSFVVAPIWGARYFSAQALTKAEQAKKRAEEEMERMFRQRTGE